MTTIQQTLSTAGMKNVQVDGDCYTFNRVGVSNEAINAVLKELDKSFQVEIIGRSKSEMILTITEKTAPKFAKVMDDLNAKFDKTAITLTGDADDGAWHRAIECARRMVSEGTWDGSSPITMAARPLHDLLFGLAGLSSDDEQARKLFKIGAKPVKAKTVARKPGEAGRFAAEVVRDAAAQAIADIAKASRDGKVTHRHAELGAGWDMRQWRAMLVDLLAEMSGCKVSLIVSDKNRLAIFEGPNDAAHAAGFAAELIHDLLLVQYESAAEEEGSKGIDGLQWKRYFLEDAVSALRAMVS